MERGGDTPAESYSTLLMLWHITQVINLKRQSLMVKSIRVVYLKNDTLQFTKTLNPSLFKKMFYVDFSKFTKIQVAEIRKVLKDLKFRIVEIVDPDAIVEGGDVLFTGLSYITYIEIKTLHIMVICSISEE